MAKLSVPSLQHMARNAYDSPDKVKQQLLKLAKNPPTFNYNVLYNLITDLTVLNKPLSDVMIAVETYINHPALKKGCLDILPLVHDYFEDAKPAFVNNQISQRHYAISRSLLIPFTPPLVFGRDENLVLPWFSFWKHDPLSGQRLSLFMTIVDELLSQDPDLEAATFEILDFSLVGKDRALTLIHSHDVPRLTSAEVKNILEIFVDGYNQAVKELAESNNATDQTSRKEDVRDTGQMDLFDALF